ncbi:MAG: hypothetical protein EB072_00960 [Betaproteobacteria bacterium]|nr:hypothetical protein [Betaproteobacteria bacterium]
MGHQQALGQTAPEAIRFIDLSKFDNDLEKALKENKESISVMFFEKTSPNNMPNRLQKWVTAVEKSGGRIDIEPPPDEPRPRSPAMLIGLLGGLWSSIKAWGEIRERALLDAAQSRNVLIHLERNAAGEIIVAKLTFTPRL